MSICTGTVVGNTCDSNVKYGYQSRESSGYNVNVSDCEMSLQTELPPLMQKCMQAIESEPVFLSAGQIGASLRRICALSPNYPRKDIEFALQYLQDKGIIIHTYDNHFLPT